MDVLTDVLRHVQVSGKARAELELGAPWSMTVPEADEAIIHIVVRGGCVLHHGDQTAHLGPGDLAFLPHGTAHTLSDNPTPDSTDLGPLLQQDPEQGGTHKTGCSHVQAGGDGPPTTIICAKFHFTTGEHHPLLAVLPPLIVLRSEDMVKAGWLEDSLRFIAREARSSEPGAQIAVDRLLDLLFIQTVRAWLRAEPSLDTGWLGALSHPQVGQALEHLHHQPEHDWTLGGLARQVGMSRSGFAAHFSRLVGVPPLRYLAGWRMRLAAEQLVDTDLTIGTVAHNLGYRSQAAFNTAFKKHFGAPPGTWRQTEKHPRTQPVIDGQA